MDDDLTPPPAAPEPASQEQPERSADGDAERVRRWQLMLGQDENLSARDRRLNLALGALYDGGSSGSAGKGGTRGGLGRSAPKVAQWLGDVREFFPTPVVQVVQRDALQRLGLQQMLVEPEFLAALEADVNLVADLISLRSMIPEAALQTCRDVVAKVVADLLERLEQRTAEAVRGAVNRTQRTTRPRPGDIDWGRTVEANLRHYQPGLRTVVPERLIGFRRHRRRIADLDEVVLCVDQSGSMATSVVYASVFAAVLASLPVVRTRLVCFDTAVLDLTDELDDPVSVLFGVQLGGGTDINQAIAYCESRIERPAQTHLVLITDLFEGGDAGELLARLEALAGSGVNVITLLALTDEGRPGHDADLAGQVAALGIPAFACTPHDFPDLMAAALNRADLRDWAAERDIPVVAPAPPDLGPGAPG